jgi:hypothetical protein
MNNEDPSLGYTIVTVLNNYSELFLIALLVVLMGVFVVIVDSFSVGKVHDLKAKLNKRILNRGQKTLPKHCIDYDTNVSNNDKKMISSDNQNQYSPRRNVINTALEME